jgi:hypothetical protein
MKQVTDNQLAEICNIQDPAEIEKKRDLTMVIVDDFDHKAKQIKFAMQVRAAKKISDLDFIAANLKLYAEGLSVL